MEPQVRMAQGLDKRDSERPVNRHGWDPFVLRWLQDLIDHNYSDSICDDSWGQVIITWIHNRVDNDCSEQRRLE